MSQIIDTTDTISSLLDLNNVLNENVLQNSKVDFLTFVRLVAPTLVSDWKMGKHIEMLKSMR